MTLPILQPQTLPLANDGHVRGSLTADERLLRKAVARCFKAQVAEVHGKVEGGAKSNAVPEKTTKWDQEVMREVRPIWFGLFKKGGDKALQNIRKFPKHAKKMAVLSWAEMQASERVEVVSKGGPGSGNFGHSGRPGEVGGSGPGGGSEENQVHDTNLFHGTYVEAIHKILSEGIVPGKAVNWSKPGATSDPTKVYTTDDFAMATYFGYQASIEARNRGEAEIGHWRCAIVKVKLEQHDLQIDTQTEKHSFKTDKIKPDKILGYALSKENAYNLKPKQWANPAEDKAWTWYDKNNKPVKYSELKMIYKSVFAIISIDGQDKLRENSELGTQKSLKATPSIVIPEWIEDPDVLDALERVEVVEKGGPGSGNFGHAGRPGEVGGSGPGGGGPARQEDNPLARFSYGKYNVMGKKFFSKHEKELRQWGKTVSAESIEALSDYQNTGADWVNSNLRKGKDPDSIGVKNLDAAMTFKLPEDVIVYRGVDSSVAEKLGKEGSVKKDLGYMSTTYDSRVLTPSSRRWPYEEILTICVPKGTYVCIPKFSNVGGWRREREVILPRGSKFVVRDSSQASLGNYMLELLPPQKSIDDMGFGFSFNDEQEWSMVLEELIQFSEKSLKSTPSIVIPEWIEDPDVLDALEAEMFEFAHNINQTTADALREELLDGMENGETISQLKNRISDISDEWVEGYRSERIARTETARAFSIGHIEAWKSTDVVGRKVWSTAGDCCPFCAELEGVAVGLDENFFKLGDEQTVEWRGKNLVMAHDYSDIKGPPLHPNCRCALIGELIDDREAAKDGGEKIVKEEKGGPGSGNFGHAGRPGEVGGSGEGNGEFSDKEERVVFYHGTKKDLLKTVLREGLKAPSNAGAHARSRSVYATRDFKNATWYADSVTHVGREAVIFEVVVPQNAKMILDEHDPLAVRFPSGHIPSDWIVGYFEVGRTSVASIPESSNMWKHTTLKSVSGTMYITVVVKEGDKSQKSLKATPSIVIPEWIEDPDVLDALERVEVVEKGGPGSGNFGHAGRPGEVGGSGPGDGNFGHEGRPGEVGGSGSNSDPQEWQGGRPYEKDLFEENARNMGVAVHTQHFPDVGNDGVDRDYVVLSKPVVLYHATDTMNIASILENGIRPSIAKDGDKLLQVTGVYLSSKNGISDWVGDKTSLLKVTLPKGTRLFADVQPNAVFVLEKIPPNWIEKQTKSLKATPSIVIPKFESANTRGDQ